MKQASSDPMLTRVRLSREAYATLTEWQAAALRRTGAKPSYAEVIDAIIDLVSGHALDVAGALAGELAEAS